METRTIGSLEVSLIGLGCNNFGGRIDEDATRDVVDAAIDHGINFLDTADSYGKSEEFLGRVLAGRRDRVVLASKFGSPLGKDKPGGAAAGYVRSAIDRSLGKLDTDRIDLYQLHRPDPNTPIAETLGALAELVREGKVREIGCSNFSAAQLREAEAAASDAGVRFVSVQNHYNVLNRDDEQDAIPVAEELGVAYIPFFPLASGLLSGKYAKGEEPPPDTRVAAWGADRLGGILSDRNFALVDELTAWAQARGHTVLELAFAWLAAKPWDASIIAGATKVAQVEANAAAADWVLTPEEVAELDALAAPG